MKIMIQGIKPYQMYMGVTISQLERRITYIGMAREAKRKGYHKAALLLMKLAARSYKCKSN